MKHSTKRLLSIMICLVMIIAMLPVGAFAADTKTVYCQAPDGWSACKVYWWGSSSTNPGWPGVDMIKTEDGIWTYDVPADATNLIFNNGSGTQTSDLTAPTDDKVMYVFANNYWTTYGKVEVTVDYYVAGSETLCGVNWSPNAPQNKMSDEDGDGIYSITYTGVAAAKDYEFKVTTGSWAESWGKDGGNYPLVVDEDNSTVTINFDSESKQITVVINDAAVEEPTPDPVVPGYYVAGSETLCGVNWVPNAAENMMSDEDGDGIYTITYKDVAVGDYEFKVTDGTWDNSWPAENYQLSVSEVCDVTICFNTADNSVTVGEPSDPSEPSEPAEVIYTVAGESALCGSDWKPDDQNNKMTDEDGDGIYTITYKDVPAGNYQFKVTNGSWEGAWPSENYLLEVKDTSDVTICFNTADNSVFVGDPAAPVEQIYTIAGESALCGSEWNPSDLNNQLTDEDGDGIYTITYKNIAAGDYMFKVTDGTWEQSWGGDGTDGNYVFRLYALSDVTVKFNPELGTIVLDIQELADPEPPTVPAAPTYYVSGDFNGWVADDADYLMTDNDDGTYTLTFEMATAGTYQLKVTDGTWSNSWGENGGNVFFDVEDNDTVTVTFDGSSIKVDVASAEKMMTILTMHVAGDEGLTGANWDTKLNQMDCAMGVYSITFNNVAAGTYNFKFLANGTWDLNWASGIEMPSGETQTAWFNATGNSSVVVTEDGSSVTLTFNMTTMDLVTGEGATSCAVIEGPQAPEEPVSKDLVLGNNNLTLAAGDVDGDTWTYTATEAGTLNITPVALAMANLDGAMEAVPAEYTISQLNRNYGVQINGEVCFDYPASVTVAGGDKVTVLIYSAMGTATALTLNLELVTGQTPEEPVSKDLVLGNNNLSLDAGDVDGDTWTYTATEAGTLNFIPVALAAANFEGTMEAVPEEYIAGQLSRSYGVQINGEAVFGYPASVDVVAGDKVTLLIYSGMGVATELTMSLSLETETPDSGESSVDLVTDAAGLAVGDKIIIAGLEHDVAISTTQNNNNRAEAAITRADGSVTFGSDVQIITLVEGTVAGTFGFQVEGGYLFAASASKNYLRTQETLDDNGSWAITIDATTGDAAIVASGENTRNTLRYNSASALFSCYGSGQQAVCIYKITGELPEPPVSKDLVLGDNVLTLEAGDVDGDTWTYTATEAGILNINPVALTMPNMIGEMEAVPADYLVGQLNRNFGLQINGETFFEYPAAVTVAAGDVVSVLFYSGMGAAAELTLNLAMAEPVSKDLVLGDNVLTLEAGDVDGDTWTYTATEAGILKINPVALSAVNMAGEMEAVPADYLIGQLNRNYGLQINGESFFEYPAAVTVAAGDVVSVLFYSGMGIATELTLNLSLEAETPDEPEAGAELVTDATSLKAGDQIIIAGLEYDVAISTTQNKNNRGQAVITKADGSITYGDDTQIITLVEGTVAGSFGLQVGEGQYLYAASSSSNHLKTTDVLDDNASWIITIDATTGEASIVAAGEYSRNTLRYNLSSTLFACYAADKAANQKAVCIYKLPGNSGGETPAESALWFEQVTVSFKDEFLVNIYFSTINMDKAVEFGMITFANEVADFSVANADNIYPATKDEATGLYRATTGGIPAKNMGDDFWLALYAKMEDGSYYYTKLVSYSPEQYAYSLLGTADETLDSLLVSMLNYGAAAQIYFEHKTDDLVNKDLTAEQLALVSDYSSDMVNVADAVPADKQGSFASTGGYTKKYPSVSFKGAFMINYYCLPEATPADGITMYYWTDVAYANNEVLTAENASGSVEMTVTSFDEYTASVKGIPARNVNDVVYVAFSYSDGTTTYNSGVMPYSIGEYCGYYAGIEHEFTDMAKATAVYGHYAKQYFG